MIITLDAADKRLAKKIGASRFKNARKRGIPNERWGPQDDEYTDREGMSGEIAFCRLHKIPPDEEVGAKTKDHDCEIDGVRIDVKTTKYGFEEGSKKGYLTSRCDKEYEVDVYALMVGEGGTYRFAGWCTHDELRKPENIGFLPKARNPCYMLHQGVLRHEPLTKRAFKRAG